MRGTMSKSNISNIKIELPPDFMEMFKTHLVPKQRRELTAEDKELLAKIGKIFQRDIEHVWTHGRTFVEILVDGGIEEDVAHRVKRAMEKANVYIPAMDLVQFMRPKDLLLR